MARPLRIQFAGALYHVMSRGVARQSIYLDEDDFRAFRWHLGQVCDRLRWRLWTYCLMPNHYHLLMETADPNLSRGMHDLNSGYSSAFNARHGRVGHLFQGRYKALLVDRDRYLLQLSRYIVRNPVRTGLCATPAEWPWSSHQALLGRPDTLMSRLDAHRLLHHFGATLDAARARYREFVQSDSDEPADFAAGPNRSILGDESFVEAAVAFAPSKVTEISRADRATRSLADYAREASSRDEAIRAAHASGAYSLRQIGDHFRLHYSTVGHIVRAGRTSSQDLTP